MGRKISKVVAIALAMLLCFSLCGCQKVDYDDGYKFVVGLCMSNTEDNWIRNYINHIQGYINDNLSDVNCVVQDSINNVENQLESLDTLVKIGADVVVVIPLDDERIGKKIDEVAKVAKVIVVGNDCGAKNYNCKILYDNVEIGKLMGEQVASNNSGNSHVLVVNGTEDTWITSRLENGFKQAIEGRVADENVKFCYGNWSKDIAENLVKSNLLVNDKIGTIVAFSEDMTKGVVKALFDYRIEDILVVYYAREKGYALWGNSIVIRSENIEDVSNEVLLKLLDKQKIDKDIIIKPYMQGD